jgi:hypothetical protein
MYPRLSEPAFVEGIGNPEQFARSRNDHFVADTSEYRLAPGLRMRDGRIIRSLADAITLLREHESRPGIDNRDGVLHGLERAQTDGQPQEAAAVFLAWARELDLVQPSSRQRRRGA